MGNTVSEQKLLDAIAPIQAIGMGLNSADVAVLSQVEGPNMALINAQPSGTFTTADKNLLSGAEGSAQDASAVADNTTNALEFKNALANVNPTTSLAAVGNDVLTGGTGSDIIFGDAVNTDVLGAARSLGLPAGSGWSVFQTLEAGTSGWTRADTLNYIRTHSDELAVESTGSGGVKRAGGSDAIDAGAGNDKVYGQEGNDSIIGGAGNDILSGGSGADTFKFNNADKGTAAAPAVDTVIGFNENTGDKLDLSDLLQGDTPGTIANYLHFVASGTGNADTTIEVYSAGNATIDQKIVLQGVTLASLQTAYGATDSQIITGLLNANKLVD